MREYVNNNLKLITAICMVAITISIIASTVFSYAADDNNNIIYTRDELSQMIVELNERTSSSNLFLNNYPVGSIYISTSNTNPSSIGGEWVRFGEGKTIVSQDSTNTLFNTVEKTGGQSTLDLSHNHSFSWTGSHYHLSPMINLRYNNQSYLGHTDNFSGQSVTTPYFGYAHFANTVLTHIVLDGVLQATNYYTSSVNQTISGLTSSSGNSTQNIMNPYITVYMWKRTG